MLFLAGARVAPGAIDLVRDKPERLVTLLIAAFAVWDVGAAFVAGITAYLLVKRHGENFSAKHRPHVSRRSAMLPA